MSSAVPVHPEDRVSFHCRMCGNCCRNLEGLLMLTPLDAFRLAQHLRKQGKAASIDDVYQWYTHTDMLTGCLPIFLVNTDGPDNACVFLEGGRCSVYADRPHTCRVYPFSVFPVNRDKVFEYHQCFDEHANHYRGGAILVDDWFRENFSPLDREFMTAEVTNVTELGRLLLRMDEDALCASIHKLLHYRYYNYDLDHSFMPQYTRNMEALVRLLQKQLEEG